MKWNSPTGQVKNLGVDAKGHYKGRTWLDEQGNERDEGELGIFGAMPYQDYLIEVETVIKDSEPSKVTSLSDEEYAKLLKWKPGSKPSSHEIIRCRLANPDQHLTSDEKPFFEKGQCVLLLLFKEDRVTKLVGPEHYMIQPEWYSFRLTSDGFAERDNVPTEKARIPLKDLLATLNKAINK